MIIALLVKIILINGDITQKELDGASQLMMNCFNNGLN